MEIKQTRLGYRLRALVKKFPDQEIRLGLAARDVDFTAYSLGYNGTQMRTTGAYAKAVQIYRQLTGEEYVG